MSTQQFIESGPAIGEVDVAAFEKRHGIELPGDYREFLLAFNGGRPLHSGFRLPLPSGTEDWRLHFFFGLNDPVESCNLDWVTELTAETRPKGLIPIASDEVGNFFYLDVARDRNGAVYFGPTPEGARAVETVFVSPSFAAFIQQLS